MITNKHHISSIAVLLSATAACSESGLAAGEERREESARVVQALEVGGTVSTMADGLSGPRGLWIVGNTVTFAEAGVGGEEPCQVGPTGETGCFGVGGTISRLRRGKVRTLVDRLPSVGDGFAANGPHDVVAFGNWSLAVVGFGFLPHQRAGFGEAAEGFGTLSWYRSTKAGTTSATLVDLTEFENENNPDGADLISNPYSLVLDGDRVLVVDAAANDLLSVTHHGVEVEAVFPERVVATPPGFEVPEVTMQSVPTGVAVDCHGGVFVSEFTGFPFPAGAARIYAVHEGSEPSVHLSGFTNIIDIAFDGDNNLYVLEHATSGLLSGDPAGRLVRVSPHGDQETVLDGSFLTYPTSVAVDHRNRVYVSNCGTCGAGAGAIVRYTP